MHTGNVNVDNVMMLYESNPMMISVPNVAVARGTTSDGRHVEAVGSHVFSGSKARGNAVKAIEDVATETDFEVQIDGIVLSSKNLHIEINREEGTVNSINNGIQRKNQVILTAADDGLPIQGFGKKMFSLMLVGKDAFHSCTLRAVEDAKTKLV